ncbi:MAG: acyl-CoA thioesterase [Muribaculaceae bacterium]
MDPHNLPDISLFYHSTPLQLRFNDVDVLGHVNNNVYLSFYDTGKAHYLETVKGSPVDWQNVDTVVANIDCAFIAPIYFQESIEVLTTCIAVHDKSFILFQIIREKNSGQIKSACKSVMVCFDAASAKSCSVSPEWRDALTSFEGRQLS